MEQYNDKKVNLLSFWQQMESPPREYGPVPFFWWSGEKLLKERLAWQLEKFDAKNLAGVNINYIHSIDGAADPGCPAYFSGEWWELWKWFVEECGRHGMAAGFDDYLVTFATKGMVGKHIIEENSSLYGTSLRCNIVEASKGLAVEQLLEYGEHFICCRAYGIYEGTVLPEKDIDLSFLYKDHRFYWIPEEGDWRVALIYCVREEGMDPLNPDMAKQTIRRYFENFEKAAPQEMGKSVNFFFQDELNFRIKRPFWHERIAAEFKKSKGYDIISVLPALWIDIGNRTPKIRMDYNDIFVSLLEESYFKPIYKWTAERGILYGCDQSARGNVGLGFEFYGDYFRTMRWFSAPGADDPFSFQKRKLFPGKVASSITHLYQRPRTWLEGYHSTGWGISPAELVSFTNQNFMSGYNLLSLHGLYYSTFGGWFEWAPPDFHFRQPYWEHMDAFNLYIKRLSFVLTRGVHHCDAAVIYPIAPFEAGMDGAGAEKACEDIGGVLFNHGIDFDYIDDQSIVRAEINGGCICVSGECYRVAILPAMQAIRYDTLIKILEFYREGGIVIAYGCLPEVSDRLGRNDPQIKDIIMEIFGEESKDILQTVVCQKPGISGTGVYISSGYEYINQTIDHMVERDFSCSTGGVTVLHRNDGDIDFYAVCNNTEAKKAFKCRFRQSRHPFVLDLLNYRFYEACDLVDTGKGVEIGLVLDSYEIRVVVFMDNASHPVLLPPEIQDTHVESHDLGKVWNFKLEPLLDNKWGDFRLPAEEGMIGPEARSFRYSEVFENGWHELFFDDSDWNSETYSYGPKFLKLGPFPSGIDSGILGILEEGLEGGQDILAGDCLEMGGCRYEWKYYEFSEKWGIEQDLLLKQRRTGPHGLKKKVPDEFIDVTADNTGDTVYLWTKVLAPYSGTFQLIVGSRSGYEVFLNGVKVLSQPEGLPPAYYPPWNLPDYTPYEQKSGVFLKKGANTVLVRCIQPEKQRLRLYAVFEATVMNNDLEPDGTNSVEPLLRWFLKEKCLPFDVYPGLAGQCGYYRFMAPPGLESMKTVVLGKVKEAWINGVKADVEITDVSVDGTIIYAIRSVTGRCMESVPVAFCVEQVEGKYGGAVFSSPIEFNCGTGIIKTGDWSQHGLSSYSGGVWYGNKVSIGKGDLNKRIFLYLGDVRVTAKVLINGICVHTLISPPWRCEVTKHLKTGENEIQIFVTNTLANHYSVEIPSGYVFDGQTVSGLLGPVSLEFIQN